MQQEEYNKTHGITPRTVKRDISVLVEADEDQVSYAPQLVDKALQAAEEQHRYLTIEEVRQKIKDCDKEMRRAAKEMRFEEAAEWRDQMRQYQQMELTLA